MGLINKGRCGMFVACTHMGYEDIRRRLSDRAETVNEKTIQRKLDQDRRRTETRKRYDKYTISTFVDQTHIYMEKDGKLNLFSNKYLPVKNNLLLYLIKLYVIKKLFYSTF